MADKCVLTEEGFNNSIVYIEYINLVGIVGEELSSNRSGTFGTPKDQRYVYVLVRDFVVDILKGIAKLVSSRWGSSSEGYGESQRI